ncbi:peptidoglycan-binding protein [Kitasatospora viridis]|uniref:Putative peptidoglycan binding protein n=1 Tax=Kitasatospora viridis TaxID=281105 RepID=A0A561UKK3_9ACTN|nr:peptidoglycan-binding protein [Kitasatospora viridis]TWF99901.1 putative peptidoglycan binding protein [Kitasatospora viridis]
MSLDSMIQTAEQSLGLSGRPNALTNDYASREGQEYAAAPWCDEAVTEWARQSGNFAAVCPSSQDYAYTVAHAQAFADAGQWHSGIDGIQAGDIAFFNWEGNLTVAGIEHVGVVTGTSGAYALTIEGNTGDVCARRVRGANVIVGYGRPPYASAVPALAPAPLPGGPEWPGEYLRLQSSMEHDDNVRTWQQHMHDRGWSIAVDGWYGQQSDSICRQFQQDSTAHGWPLAVDGVVGPATWDATWRRPVS